MLWPFSWITYFHEKQAKTTFHKMCQDVCVPCRSQKTFTMMFEALFLFAVWADSVATI